MEAENKREIQDMTHQIVVFQFLILVRFTPQVQCEKKFTWIGKVRSAAEYRTWQGHLLFVEWTCAFFDANMNLSEKEWWRSGCTSSHQARTCCLMCGFEPWDLNYAFNTLNLDYTSRRVGSSGYILDKRWKTTSAEMTPVMVETNKPWMIL